MDEKIVIGAYVISRQFLRVRRGPPSITKEDVQEQRF
jgi:hypothetical protein